MTELIPGKRYRVAVEGIARDANLLSLGDGVALYPNVLNLATFIELLPDPLPTTPGSVVMDQYKNAWQLRVARWWRAGSEQGERADGPFLNEYGPFDVLFDAGAEK